MIPKPCSLCWACHSYPLIPERRHATAHATRFALASLMAECCWTGISYRAPLQAQRGMVSGDARDGGINSGRVGVEVEAIGLGDAFQSGIRPVEWADGANHEGLATLLRADGDPVGDGTAQKMRHGISLFGGVEFQPGAFGVLFQQALAFQAATYALADQLNQARGNRSSNSSLTGALTRWNRGGRLSR